jgi:DNA topoisomerase-1
MEKRKKALEKLREQLAKLELQATDKEENKEIALGTSKLNYLDPRISVAWYVKQLCLCVCVGGGACDRILCHKM